jgi:hypothetical protein
MALISRATETPSVILVFYSDVQTRNNILHEGVRASPITKQGVSVSSIVEHWVSASPIIKEGVSASPIIK